MIVDKVTEFIYLKDIRIIIGKVTEFIYLNEIRTKLQSLFISRV